VRLRALPSFARCFLACVRFVLLREGFFIPQENQLSDTEIPFTYLMDRISSPLSENAGIRQRAGSKPDASLSQTNISIEQAPLDFVNVLVIGAVAAGASEKIEKTHEPEQG
jgi:hypothetical protein